jgi:serine/threonine protein kinase
MTPLRHNRLRIFDLRIGDCVMVGDVPYTAERALRGGMGLVILLRQKSDCVPLRFSVHGLSVALKTVLPEFISKESTLLFRRELAVWAGFRHPNIINLNEILDGEADGWIAAMHWCVGSLRDVISKHHRLPLAEATRILGDIIAGLSYAHGKDAVLHLDLKPENILYDGDIGRFLDNGGDSASLRSSRFMISDGLPPNFDPLAMRVFRWFRVFVCGVGVLR